MSPRSSIACAKMFSKPLARSAQTMHPSCVKIHTTCKWTKTSLHLSLVTKEYHQVRPKRFLSLSYIRCKPCTYLAPTLTLSPNGLKQDSTRPMSPRSSIGCAKMFSKPMAHSAQTMHLSCVRIRTTSKWTKTSFHLSLVT